MRIIFAIALVTTLFIPSFGQQTTGQPVTGDNNRLTEIFQIDQAARQGKNIDWQKVRSEDEERRQEVRHMLDAGEVRTASDYFHAALIFQHGEKPEDYLFAHVLAVNSIILGNQNARWLAAATLDRYLIELESRRSLGLNSARQKMRRWGSFQGTSSLLSDSIRATNCVVPVATQEQIIEGIEAW